MNRNGLRNQTRRGFSLLEAIIGLVLLAGGIVVLASMFSASTLAVEKSKNNQIAADAAGGLVERMREVGINSLNYTNFPATFNVYDPADPTKQVGTGTLTITPVMLGQSQPVYFEISIATTVTGTRGMRGDARVVTYIAPR